MKSKIRNVVHAVALAVLLSAPMLLAQIRETAAAPITSGTPPALSQRLDDDRRCPGCHECVSRRLPTSLHSKDPLSQYLRQTNATTHIIQAEQSN
jgi:hypothetical protein